MRRRTAAILATVLLSGTAAVAAILTQSGPDRVPLTEQAGQADKVTLYQNGLAFVELNRRFTAGTDNALLELPVPATTIVDSIRVSGDGVDVREIRAAPTLAGPMQAGDELVVHVEDRTYEGILVEQRGDALVLAQGSNATVVPGDAIEAIEVRGLDLSETDASATRVSVLTDPEPGNRTIKLTYLARGPAWTPNYHLDLDTGQATFFATLTGLHTWQNVTLDLVSGEPNVVAQPSSRARDDGFDTVAEAGAGAPSYDVGVSGPAPLGELHRYTLDHATNLTRGETLRLPVRTGELDIERNYRSVHASLGFGDARGTSRSVDVLERYEIENTFDEPLPPGVMRFYRENTWVGEDVVQGVPAGETTNVTAARSLDVTANVVLASFESTPSVDTRTYRLTVTNAKTSGEAIDLQAQLTHPFYRTSLTSTQPEPTRVTGTTVTWDTTLEANDTATFQLTYEQRTNNR